MKLLISLKWKALWMHKRVVMKLHQTPALTEPYYEFSFYRSLKCC